VALSRVVVACAARTCLACLAVHQRQVHAVLCLAENAINERAVRNDDIITL
jgi:leucyl aminopeptidase